MAKKVLFLLLSLWCAASAIAAETVSIKDILAHPETYRARTVTLEGTVDRLEDFNPYVNHCSFYDSYRFQLTDGSRSLEITVFDPCETGKGTMPPVVEGEKLLVQALIGIAPDDRSAVFGVAQLIKRY